MTIQEIYTIHYGSDTERNAPDTATTLSEAIKLAHQSILSVIGGNAYAHIYDRDGQSIVDGSRAIKSYRYDEHGDYAGEVYEVEV